MTKQTEKTGEQLLAEDIEKSKGLSTTLNAVSNEQLDLSEKVGALKATGFFKKVGTVTEIKLLAEIKQNKQYKDLKVCDFNGNWLHVTTWADFCKTLGYSREKIDEDIRNLATFGEDFLETSQRMGVGYRDLRRLRALPEDDREVIINAEAVKSEDKEDLLDIIEEMTEKHIKAKAVLQKQLDDEKAERQAVERIVSQKQKRIDELDREIVKQETMTVPEKEAHALNVLSASFNLCKGAILDVGVKVADVLHFDSPAAQQSCLGTLLILRNEIDRVFTENDLHGVLMDTGDGEIDDIIDKAMLAIDKDDSESE